MNAQSTVEAVLAGDPARFTDLVRRFDRPVRRIVARQLRNPQDREEVVQETWCRVFRQLAKLGDSSKVDAWIARIARNCATDHLRHRRCLSRFVPLDEMAARPKRVEWVWELVERLEPVKRDVLVWRYGQFWSYAEIAERLGVPVSTVRGRLFADRDALRRLIEHMETRG